MNGYKGIPSAYFVNVACFPFALAGVLLNENGEYTQFLSFVILAVGLISVLRVRKNWCLFLIYSCILYCNYSIIVTMYLTDDLQARQSLFMTYKYSEIAIQGINIMGIFTYLLLCAAPEVKNKHRSRSILTDNKYNAGIVLAIVVLLVLIYMFGLKSPEFNGREFRSGAPASIYEYSTIFVMLGFYYSGDNKFFRRLLFVIAVMLMLKVFIYGERVAGVQIMLMLILALSVEKLNFWLLMPPGVMVYIAMLGVGHYRANFSLSGNILEALIESILKSKFSLDTAYAAYHASLTYLDTLNITGFTQRIYLFMQWIISQFLGKNVPDSQLAVYSNQFFHNLGGGILPYWCYFYLGIFGLIIMTVHLHYIFRLIRDSGISGNAFTKILSVYSTCAVLRWYLYTPTNIVRSLLLLAVAYYFLIYVDRMMRYIALTLKRHSSE